MTNIFWSFLTFQEFWDNFSQHAFSVLFSSWIHRAGWRNPARWTANQVSRKQCRMSSNYNKRLLLNSYLLRFVSFDLRTWQINPSKDHQVCYFNRASVDKRKSMTGCVVTVCDSSSIHQAGWRNPARRSDNQVSRKQDRMSSHTIKGYYEIVFFAQISILWAANVAH